MIKTFKKKNNSSLRKKKISLRNKSKKNRKSISKIQRILKRKQKGGVIDLVVIRTARELNLNAVLEEYLVDGNKAVIGYGGSRKSIMYLIPYNEIAFLTLHNEINRNINLQKIRLRDAILIESTSEASAYSSTMFDDIVNDQHHANKFSDNMLQAIFNFNPAINRLEIDLELSSVSFRKFQRNEAVYQFNTNVLVNFFDNRPTRKITKLNLKGWKFTAAGLYNLAKLELSGCIDGLEISNSFTSEEFTSTFEIDYKMIKDKFIDIFNQPLYATIAAIRRPVGHPVHPLELMVKDDFKKDFKRDMKLVSEEKVSVDDILILCNDVNPKIIIILSLLLKNYSGPGQYLYHKFESYKPLTARTIPIELISVLFMKKTTEEEKELFNTKITQLISEMLISKLKKLYSKGDKELDFDKLPHYHEQFKSDLLFYMSELSNLRIKFFEELMWRMDPEYPEPSDIIKIIFPEITPEDIKKYKEVQEDLPYINN
jgi:hypothetical protein